MIEYKYNELNSTAVIKLHTKNIMQNSTAVVTLHTNNIIQNSNTITKYSNANTMYRQLNQQY